MPPVDHTDKSTGKHASAGRSCEEGGGVFPMDEWRKLCDSLSLTRRQEQVLDCLLRDMSDTQIARCLGLATSTVRMHLGLMYKKLGVEDRVGLVIRVFRKARRQAEADGRPQPSGR
jgi:DNA-binding CsgD family transcriptional regulator